MCWVCSNPALTHRWRTEQSFLVSLSHHCCYPKTLFPAHTPHFPLTGWGGQAQHPSLVCPSAVGKRGDIMGLRTAMPPFRVCSINSQLLESWDDGK